MATASAFDFLPVNDVHCPVFLSKNEQEYEIQHLLDAAIAEELQFQEALKASLFTCETLTSGPSAKPWLHLHVKEIGGECKSESSRSFCDICRKKKENDQVVKNGDCVDHSFCSDCISKHVESNIKEGFEIVTCPASNCDSVINLDSFRHFLTEDVLNLWEKKVSISSEEMRAKTNAEKDLRKASTAGSSTGQSLPLEFKTADFSPHARNSEELDSHQIVPEKKYETAAKSIPGSFFLQPTKVKTGPFVSARQLKFSISRGNEMFELVDSTPIGSRLDRKEKSDSGPQKSSRAFQAKISEKNVSDFAATNDDDDDDLLPHSDEYDLEESPRSPEICKWFKEFLEGLEYLSTGESKDPAREWHCPACQGSAGAIKGYRGLRTLIQHAQTIGSRRVRLHRVLAHLLEEKLQCDSQAFSATSTGEAVPCAKWKGLKDEKKDYEIVWPPMVVISNTLHKKDENNKWIGMTNQELLDMFSSYNCIIKVQQAYNYMGHCGRSILIFESSVRGYLEADHLHRHFAEEGTGRNAWSSRPVYFLPSGERQLYGYMATKEDVDAFNQDYFKGKPKLKYEMKSYREMVVNQIRQMSEDNNQLLPLKNRVAEQQRHAKDLEESNTNLKEKLHMAKRDMDILRSKVKQQHEQSLEEMEYLEQFYKDKIRDILEAREENDGDHENRQQAEEEGQENEEQSNLMLSKRNNYKHKKEDIAKPVENKDHEAERFKPIVEKRVINKTRLAYNKKRQEHKKQSMVDQEIDWFSPWLP